MPGLSYVSYTARSTDVDLAVAAGAKLRCYGFSIEETAATAGTARVRLLNGSIATGEMFLTIPLAPNEGVIQTFEGGIEMPNGLSIDVTSGTVDIAVYYASP